MFDLDGVFYKGKETRKLIGGKKVIHALRRKGKGVCVLTNNSTDTVSTVHSRLKEFGLDISKEEVLTSAMLTADYLKQKHGRVAYFLVGEKGLDSEMRRAGHRRVMEGQADFVVVGLDRSMTYEKLDRAVGILRNGAGLIATHRARLYMYNAGPAMATGPIVAALEYASEKKAVSIGKPSPLMFKIALSRWKVRAEEALMVGDQVETDLVGAARAGVDSILVKTGVDLDPGSTRPVAVLENVDDLAALV